MKKALFALLCILMSVLSSSLSAQRLSSDYSEVLLVDSTGYQVAKLTPAALTERLREARVSFGNGANSVLLNADGEEVFHVPFPPTRDFISDVIDIVLKNGGYPVSNGRVRAVFKQIEVENKDFDLAKTVDEEDWDY